MMIQFESLGDNWYKKHFDLYDSDKSASTKDTAVIIDLSTISYISFYELLNLFLTINHFLCKYKLIQIRLYGIGPFSHDLILPVDEYNKMRTGEIALTQSDQYKTADIVYSLISYLKHYDFFSALNNAKALNRISIPGVSEKILSNLYKYSGIGEKILALLPIFNNKEVSEFRYEESINTWIKNVPDPFAKHPIFRDREFSRVFGYQLTKNILEHSNLAPTESVVALGVICMQILPNDKFEKIKSNYPKDFHGLFTSENSGVLEICVGDRGIGIYNSLKEHYLELFSKIGNNKRNINEEVLIREVISFAFDEIGSNKTYENRIGGVHALHRILKSTAKYGGIMRLKSNGYEFIFNCFLNNLERSKSGFGFKPDKILKYTYPSFGVQYQILIPLDSKKFMTKPLPRKSAIDVSKGSTRLKFILVPLEAFFKEDIDYSDYNKVIKHIGFINFTNNLFEEPDDTLIIYDFYGRGWSEDEIALILLSQKALFHTKFCIGINLPRGIPASLREREKQRLTENRKTLFGNTDFFDVLSSKHRLLPLFDMERNLYWLGLGKYEFDKILTLGYNRDENEITEDDVFHTYLTEDEKAVCILYLNTNNQLFIHNACDWQCRLSDSLYQEIIRLPLRYNFDSVLNSLKCILEKDNQKYLLPSSKKLADKFIKTINLFQNHFYVKQISWWFANAIIDKLNQDEDQLIILTSTAPSELLSKIVSDALYPKKVYILNVGYSSVFHEEILYSTKDWQNIPVFFITDVIDKGGSIKELKEKLKNKIAIRGVLTLFDLENELDESPKIVAEWMNIKNDILESQCFVFAQMKRPRNIDWINPSFNDKVSIIEPFSLKEYDLAVLTKKDRYKNRLKQISDEFLLREGHWVYEQHHFSITISVREMLLNNNISGDICKNIIEIIRKSNINLLLIPLHSNIRDIVPNILLYTKLFLRRSLNYYYCISTKALSEKPFYILPYELEYQLQTASDEYNILIIDDAVVTGRTQETIIRAVLRATSHNKNLKINQIKVYSVLSRLGRARNTFWSSINELKHNEQNIKFSFLSWITMEIPAFDKENCPLCKERNQLISLKQTIESHSTDVLLQEIDDRIFQLTPYSTESPTFIKKPDLERNFNHNVCIGDIETKSNELALWQFNNLLHRGYPFVLLINDLKNISSLNDSKLDYLQVQICKLIIFKWERIGSRYSEKEFVEYINKEINKGSLISKYILSYIGNKLAEIKDKETKKLIFNIIDNAIFTIDKYSIGKEANTIVKCRNITIALYLLLAIYNNSIANIIDEKQRKEEYEYIEIFKTKLIKCSDDIKYINDARVQYKNIYRWLVKISSKQTFLSALIFVLDHTVRAARYKSHTELLPSLLYMIGQGIPMLKEYRQLIIETIHYFVDSISELLNYQIFDDKTRLFTTPLLYDLNNLINSINEDIWVDNTPSKQTSDLANEIYCYFPHNKCNRIYEALASSHLEVKYYIEDIEKICRNKNIELIKELQIIDLNDFNIIVPPPIFERNEIHKFLENYLYDPPITISKPKIKLILKINEEKTKVIFKILTKLSEDDEARKICNTHATLKINFGNTSLFGIESSVNFCQIGEYNIEINILFVKGYKIK
jgi:hypoxanthine-guanine phosphoribosyltransferase